MKFVGSFEAMADSCGNELGEVCIMPGTTSELIYEDASYQTYRDCNVTMDCTTGQTLNIQDCNVYDVVKDTGEGGNINYCEELGMINSYCGCVYDESECIIPEPEPDPNTDPNPCNQADALEQNQAFKNKMKDLKEKTGLDYEESYLFSGTGESPSDYTHQTGISGQPGITFNLNSISNGLNGYIHSHYGNVTSPIFSMADIQAIYTLYNGGKISDLSTFTLGVVTNWGTQYILRIDDVSSFLGFYNSHFSTNAQMDNLTKSYLDDVADLMNNSNKSFLEASELAFLKNLEGAGIKTFKGNNDFNIWNPIKKVNNQVEPDNCN